MTSSKGAAGPRPDVLLAPLTTLRIGGPAQWYQRAATEEQASAALAWAAARGVPVFVLGGGSNVVVADRGFAGLVLHVTVAGIDLRPAGDEAVLTAGAGEAWDGVVARAVDAGYAGLECLSGIPGCVGGTPIQNVGAYGQEVSATIRRVTAVDTRSNQRVSISGEECEFGYRHSRFKGRDAGRFVVLGVEYRVRRGNPTLTYPDVVAWIERHGPAEPAVADVRRAVLDIRRRKGMVLEEGDPDTRSVGSFFMNPVVAEAKAAELGAPSFPAAAGVKVPAAWLIERAGFGKGFVAGAVGLSSKHPLAIVNRGGARAADVLALACRIKQAVLDAFGVVLRPEPIFVGLDEDDRVRFLQQADD